MQQMHAHLLGKGPYATHRCENLQFYSIDPGMSAAEYNEEVFPAAPEVHKFYDGVVEKLQKEGRFNAYAVPGTTPAAVGSHVGVGGIER